MMSSADSNAVTTMAEKGMPERGRFMFFYSYNGEAFSDDLYMDITLNGTPLVNFTSLAPVSNKKVVDKVIKKDDIITFYVSYGEKVAYFKLHRGLFGYSPGYWAGQGYVTFYLRDPSNGSIVDVLGTMNYTFYHLPPWNGITVKAEPEKISAGEAATITIQPHEVPGKPVILPDITYINLQTSFLGDLIGGLSLPEYGLRYTQGFVNAPWGLLKDTEILYEVHPSIKTSSPIHIPVYAYSPYDVSTLGLTTVEVGEEEELELTLNIPDPEIWPTIPEKYGGNYNENNVLKNIKVLVTEGEKPEKNKRVKITASMVLPSGGHKHIKQPEDFGIIKDINSGNTGNGMIISKTNENGEIFLEYASNEFGGKIRISASPTSSTSISDDETVLVRVPKLVQMEKSSYYILTGATSTHIDTHWIKKSAKDSLVKASKIFFYSPWNTNDERMRLNDLSLPYGGLFDISGAWKQPHKSHRLGTDIDIENLNRIAELRDIMEKLGWIFVDEGQLSGKSTKYPHFRLENNF